MKAKSSEDIGSLFNSKLELITDKINAIKKDTKQ